MSGGDKFKATLEGRLVRAGGVDYRIVEETKSLDAAERLGQTDTHKCTLEIRTDVSWQRIQQTICHEVVHILLKECGLPFSKWGDEVLVEPLGNVLYLFLKDNPELLRLLTMPEPKDEKHGDEG